MFLSKNNLNRLDWPNIMEKYRIALFPGDGVGPELIEQSIKLLEKAAELDKFEIEWAKFPHCAEHYLDTKELIDEKILKELNRCKAIYMGTLGHPEANGIIETGILGPIRKYMGHFAMVKPVKLYSNVESSIKANGADFILIREVSEDFYVEMKGAVKGDKSKQQFTLETPVRAKIAVSSESKDGDFSYQMGILSKRGCERLAKFAMEYAKSNSISSATATDKSSMLGYYQVWKDAIESSSKSNGIEMSYESVGQTAMNIIRQPEKYRMILAPNMFGEILGDISNMAQGMSFSYGGYVNPRSASLFMPMHGSAIKLREKGVVCPAATMLSGALMMEIIGQKNSANLIRKAVGDVLKDDKKTQDLGGLNTSAEMSEEIIDKLVELHD
jgi:isocitrate/isopropylmalate dehydrogenase